MTDAKKTPQEVILQDGKDTLACVDALKKEEKEAELDKALLRLMAGMADRTTEWLIQRENDNNKK